MTPLSMLFSLVRNHEQALGSALELQASGHLTSFEALDTVRHALRRLADARTALERETVQAVLPEEVPAPALGVLDDAPVRSRRDA